MTWWPLSVRGGVLRAGDAAFAPEGLRLAGETFGWDDVGGRGLVVGAPDRWPTMPSAGWTLDLVVHHFGAHSVTGSVVVAVRTGQPPDYDEPMRAPRAGAEVLTAHTYRVVAAAALAAFLRDEPGARAGLADPARVTALLDRLHHDIRAREKGQREPWMGDRYDLHWAVVRALRATFPRRYDDRRVDVDPLPPLAELVGRARAALRPGLRDRMPEHKVADRVRRLAGRPPWPFGVLLPDPRPDTRPDTRPAAPG